jgi:predicted Zn-dependent peptidase
MVNRYKLTNGLKILELKRKSDIVTIQITINVGSNNEDKKIAGISHFIEHMVFEGTKKKTSSEIANFVEGLGGEMSAYTSNEITCFYVKIVKKYFEKALDVLSDILINPLFDVKLIEKERPIILSEINMVQDQPRHYQWTLFYQTVFNKFPTKNPIYGRVDSVKSISKKDLIDYYSKFYTAPNTVVTVVGNIDNLKGKVSKYFKGMSSLKTEVKFIPETVNKRNQKIEKKKINQSYAVLGYKTPCRNEFDSYVLDVVRAVLGRGLSGKLFRTIRIKHGLAYDVGINSDPSMNYGTFSAYFSTDKKNIDKCVKLCLEEFKKLKKITSKELVEAKQFLEGEFVLDKENSQSLAAEMGQWELVSNAEDGLNYVKKIKKVTKKDIIRVVNKYLNDKYSLAVIKQN